MKKLYSLIILFISSITFFSAQLATINITTSGGSYATEKWVSITDGINGGGTFVWGQNGCNDYISFSCRGLINQDIQIAAGTYYVNCYDSYGDGWDGTSISVTSYGAVLATGQPGSNGLNLVASYQIVVVAPPSCLPVTGLTASNLTSTSANISWTAGGTVTAWNFEYGSVGFTQGTGTLSALTSANTSLTGLTAQTQYDVYVQADCGGSTSSWTGPFTFTTLCSTAASPYLEDFDAAVFPVCWSQPTTDDFNWTLDANGTGSTGTGPSDDISGGGNYMYIEASGGTNGNEAVLLSQEIDLSTLANGQLRFFSHMYGSAINTLTVDISLDAGATFTQVFTKTGDQGNQWNEELVNISSYTGNAMFKITASQGSGFAGDIAIDDFEIRNNTVCSQPTALVASNLSANTADISWIAGGSEPSWNFEFGANGYTQGTGGTASTVSSSATIADNPNSLFANGPAAWPHVLTACLANQGASSQPAQTVTINVTSLPSGGTNYQKYKTLATGNNLSGAIPLTLGLNTLSVTAVTYDRTVKFRFDNDGFSFDEITLNGVSVYSSAFTSL